MKISEPINELYRQFGQAEGLLREAYNLMGNRIAKCNCGKDNCVQCQAELRLSEKIAKVLEAQK